MNEKVMQFEKFLSRKPAIAYYVPWKYILVSVDVKYWYFTFYIAAFHDVAFKRQKYVVFQYEFQTYQKGNIYVYYWCFELHVRALR